MKSDIREIITDIKAAAQIGMEETLWLSLDALLDLPQVSGNTKMEEPFIYQLILPIGETLADSNLSIDQIMAISKNSYAVFRAISVVALTKRFFTMDEGSLNDLEKFAQDPRLDVRSSFSISAGKFGELDQKKLVEMIARCFHAQSPKTLGAGISLLPALTDYDLQLAFEYLENIPFTNDNVLRLLFSDTLTKIALAGHTDKVLEFMGKLENRKEDYLWIITKSLSGSWAAEYPEEALAILKNLSKKYKSHKLIRNAIKSLIRHGANEVVERQLSLWKDDLDKNLSMAATEYLAKE